MAKNKTVQTNKGAEPNRTDLKAQVKRLKAENRKLRKENEDLASEVAGLELRIDSLELANRQLLRDYDHLADMDVCVRMAALEVENRRLRDAMREIAHFAVETGCVIEPSERVAGKKKG